MSRFFLVRVLDPSLPQPLFSLIPSSPFGELATGRRRRHVLSSSSDRSVPFLPSFLPSLSRSSPAFSSIAKGRRRTIHAFPLPPFTACSTVVSWFHLLSAAPPNLRRTGEKGTFLPSLLDSRVVEGLSPLQYST